LVLSQGIEGMLLDARSTDRLSAIVATFDSPHFTALSTGGTSAAHLTSPSYSAAQTDSLLRWTRWLVHFRRVAASPTAALTSLGGTAVGSGVRDCAEPGTEATAGTSAGAAAGVKKPVAKKRNSTEVELSALSTSHLLAVLCILSYTSAEGSAQRGEDYLIKFDAGMLSAASMQILFHT
jgi:hypothetical protein